jgi:hypothetical protein
MVISKLYDDKMRTIRKKNCLRPTRVWGYLVKVFVDNLFSYF